MSLVFVLFRPNHRLSPLGRATRGIVFFEALLLLLLLFGPGAMDGARRVRHGSRRKGDKRKVDGEIKKVFFCGGERFFSPFFPIDPSQTQSFLFLYFVSPLLRPPSPRALPFAFLPAKFFILCVSLFPERRSSGPNFRANCATEKKEAPFDNLARFLSFFVKKA